MKKWMLPGLLALAAIGMTGCACVFPGYYHGHYGYHGHSSYHGHVYSYDYCY